MREEQLQVQSIPGTLWMPERRPIGTVLVGHGLGVARFHPADKYVAQQLTDRFDLAVIAPEIPLHGVRSGSAPTDLVAAWRAFWADGGWRQVNEEFLSFARYAETLAPKAPLGYFGLSLGTQYGLPFIATHGRVAAAVLGLFGSLPEPRTRLMNNFAPLVTCPTFFIQQSADEIHPAETTQHLFDSLGSQDKTLEPHAGRHADVPRAALDRAADFLALHLCPPA